MATKLVRPTNVEPRGGHRVWLRFSDCAAGEVDVSHLAGRGVFKLWDTPGCFEAVHIAPSGGIAWGDDFQLCPDALYIQLTGKPLAEVIPATELSGERA